MTKTNELQIGREYTLRVLGETRRFVYIGEKQKEFERSSSAYFVEVKKFDNGRSVASDNLEKIEVGAIKVIDQDVTFPLSALFGGMIGRNLDKFRKGIEERKYGELLAVA